ncbi:hypothetical protein E2562_006918 [Oryza meyeriana var. granulata]|uniref:non-specific serine/threonine protein kinase n=1 Tax=Oryza meyeriana var. granulata TaxID=110450 RepID=A0A6G1BJH8_9ORYZ|nr:hypothetical protein E2562_006918 [Oryza meyeriana var. granulata]
MCNAFDNPSICRFTTVSPFEVQLKQEEIAFNIDTLIKSWSSQPRRMEHVKLLTDLLSDMHLKALAAWTDLGGGKKSSPNMPSASASINSGFLLNIASPGGRIGTDFYKPIDEAGIVGYLKNFLSNEDPDLRAKACSAIGNMCRYNPYFYSSLRYLTLFSGNRHQIRRRVGAGRRGVSTGRNACNAGKSVRGNVQDAEDSA